jgi:type VI secretion system protein
MFKVLCALVFVVAGSTGCSNGSLQSILSMQTAKVWLNKVSFRVADDVNDSSPVTLHILIPYKDDLLSELSKMSAEDYFKKSEQIKKDNAGNLDVFSWDLIRSQKLDDEPISPTKVSGVGILVFVRYSTPGDHRILIADDEAVLINLNKGDFSVESAKQK